MKIVAFFAHPDDETFLCGGTLAQMSRQGVEVHYLCATRGEGGELGNPPLCPVEKAGEVRSQELVCAVHALGGTSLDFMGYIDPRIGAGYTHYAFNTTPQELTDRLTEKMRVVNADMLVTHGSHGEYGHPGHLLVHQAAKMAIAQWQERGEGTPPLFYTCQASFKENPLPSLDNPDDPAHLVLNVSNTLPEKTTAALCHRTQHDLFLRSFSQEMGRSVSIPEIVMPLESFHRVYPPVKDSLDDSFVAQVREAGLIRYIASGL